MRDLVQILESLLNIMNDEGDAYQKLFELEMSSRHLLSIQSLDVFWTNLQERETLIQLIDGCESQRQQLASALASLFKLDQSTLTMSQLSTYVPEPYASRLRHERTKLHRIVAKTQQCIEENAIYLRSSLLLVNKGLDCFKLAAEPHTTYRAHGTSSVTQRGLIFSKRI